MQSPPLRRGGSAQHSAEAFTFEGKLENEEAVLDAILVSMARGTLDAQTWDRLRSASQRDGRMSELAFAFETASQAKRVKGLPPALAAEFLFQAACFFADVFGDEVGAVTYLERALVLAPTHALSFLKIEQILQKTQQTKKLADVCASVAHYRARGEQPLLLRRAAELLSQAGGADDKVIELLQQVLRLEPGDEQTRDQLEALLLKANRLRDLARLNEQALSSDPPPSDAMRMKLLSRIIDVYADKLHEPERAMPHVEQLLTLDPANEQGRKIAQRLVVVKGLAGRAAAALANACSIFGTPQEVARYLLIELDHTRGPKRAMLLARLGRLKEERLSDAAGAFEAFEQALGIDAVDEDARTKYVELARKLGRYPDAAKTLARVLGLVKDSDVKARTTAQLGEMLRLAGDARRAKQTLAVVLGTADSPPDAQLTAAYALSEIHQEEGDARTLSEVLERISLLETSESKRQEADERLARLAAKLGDKARAMAAYERLLATSARGEAMTALAALYEGGSDPEKHARLLEEQAKDTPDPHEARARMIRAAEMRATAGSDAAAAIASCRAIVDRFGPARDVLALLAPLLESQRRWPDLAQALVEEAALTTGPERARAMTRLGTIRMQRLGDIGGAIEALGEALALDAGDKTARMTLEKLTVMGDHRLAAARVLEGLYRAQGVAGSLLKVLELRGALEPEVGDRLGALREAAQLAEGPEPVRAVEIIGRAVADAVANNADVGEWLARLDAAAAGTDAKRRAAILGKAIGEREVDSNDLSALAKRAAEAHAVIGEVQAAIALYRRALSFEPHSAELLQRIDDLLRDQGSPTERVALYRAALARSNAAGKVALLHRIGAIERDDLKDTGAAIETYRAALDIEPNDTEALAALRELYSRSGRWHDLCVLLEGQLAHLEGRAARATRAMLAKAAAAQGDADLARAQCARLLGDPELGSEELDAVEQAAQAIDDANLQRSVLLRRVDLTQDPREQIGWLDQLAELDEKRRGDLEEAASTWKRAASLAEAAGDDDVARRLYLRARKVAPEDRDATARLVALCERIGSWDDMPRLYASLREQSSDDAERVELWMRTARVLSERLDDVAAAARGAASAFELAPGRADVLSLFEELSTKAGMVGGFDQAIHDTLARTDPSRPLDDEQRGRLMLSRARVLSSDPARVEDAVHAYRSLLEDRAIDRAQVSAALAAFEALVDLDPDSPHRRADRRWLLGWRAEHAPEGERALRLLEWARSEETNLSDPARALTLYRRVLDLDSESEEALSAMTRLALATGDADVALGALRARRDRAQGTARVAIELEIAQVLLSSTTHWPEALSALRAVLKEVPNDPTARELAGRLLAHGTTRAEALKLLESACDATEDVATREQILARLLEAPADADEPEARRGWFEKLCDLQRDQGRAQDAVATAVRAAREMPQVPAFWDRAEELARTLSRPEDMAALYDEVLARALTGEQARQIGERAVQFHEEWFDEPARVVRILERVLALNPTDDWAFDRLKLLFDASERWDELFALYDRMLEIASGRKRALLLEEAAQTAKDFADRPERAIQYFEQLSALKPGEPRLTSALERLYERQGSHRELVSLLTARLPSLKRDEAERTRGRIALLQLDGLGDPVAAFDVIEPVLENARQLANGATQEIGALLERILTAAAPTLEQRRSTVPPARASERPTPKSKRGRKSAPPSPTASVRQRIAAWLREHYARAGRDADLVRMLLVGLEAVTAPKERMRRYVEIADVYERLGDGVSALEQLGAAVVLDPGDETKRAKLAELADRTGRLARFADLLSAAADASDEKGLRVALTMQAAALRADRVADAAGAILLLTSVLSTPRLDDEHALAAARQLEPLLQASGRDEEQLEVVERIASVEHDATTRRDALGRAAGLAARLGQDARAIALWERRLVLAENDREALDHLVELLERTAGSERLVEVLELRAGAAATAEHRRSDRVRVAHLLGDVLDRPKDAIAAWLEIQRDFGDAEDVAFALAALLRKTRRWKELAKLLERGAEQTTDSGAGAELLRQLGDLYRVELDERAIGVQTYARALAAEPRNAGARQGLLSFANDEGFRAPAVRVLLDALRACNDWRGVLELTEQRLLAANSNSDKLEVLREAAQIAEHRAGDPALAFEAVRRALLIVPSDEGIERDASRLADEAKAWQRLVDAYREAIDGAARGDAALVARLRTRAGVTLETRLDDPRGALAAYLQVVSEASDVEMGCAAIRVAGRINEWEVGARAVVDVAGARETAVAQLLDAYARAAEESGQWSEATRALTSVTSSSALRGKAARDLEARVAEWHRDHVGNLDAARAAVERALEHDESDPALLTMLAELQRQHGGRPLIATLLRLSRARGGDSTLLHEAAEVAGDVRDAALARDILTDLLACAGARDAPDERVHAQWAIERLAQLHTEQGDDRAVVDVLVQGGALPFEKGVRRDMRQRAARIAVDRLGDGQRAIELYLLLFDDDPHDDDAAERLASLYASHGRPRDLLSLRERQIAVASDPGARIALRLVASRLLVELGETSRATAMLRSNLEEDPRHVATVKALAEILDTESHATELCDLLLEQAQRAQDAGDVEQATELWWRAAILAEERLGDAAAAETYHTRVAGLTPHPPSLDALGRLSVARGDHRGAAQWLERLLNVVDPDRRVDTTLRLADALLGAGEGDLATERLALSLAEAPQAESIRAKLASLYRERANWEKLAALTADGAAHSSDKSTRMARLLEAATLYAERCAQPQLAIPLLEQARDLTPQDQHATLLLADALARSERFDEARTLLKSMVDAFGGRRPKERAPVHYQIARLELAMGNRARALVELDAAARVDSQNPDILRALAELARDDGQLERAEKSYRALLVVLRRREEAGEARSIARSEVLLELSAIAERQGEHERSREILESALEAGTRLDFEQGRLEEALRARSDYETLARVLESKVARGGDSPTLSKTLVELGELFADRLGKPAQALTVRLRAVALEPRSDAAHQAALTLAREATRVQDYVEGVTTVVEHAIEVGDGGLARSMLFRLGEVVERDLRDDRRAAEFYERAVELGHKGTDVLCALDRVFDRLGDVQKQARALAMRIELETKDGETRAASDASYRLAALRLGSRETFDEGVGLLDAALRQDPQFERAEEVLRRAIAIDPTHLPLLSLFERIGRQPGNERALVEALRLRAELPDAPVDVLREAVETATRIGDSTLAESLLERFTARERTTDGHAAPEVAWALNALADLRRDSGDWARALELKQAAARLADPDVARRLSFEVARIAAEKQGDWAVAAETYEALHDADPADRDAWEPLLIVYRHQGAHRKLAKLLASVVDYVDDSALRARLRLERVRAMQQLGLPDAEAGPLLREIVDDDASQVDAALMLAAILERSGARSELTDLLATQIDAAKDRSDASSVVSLSLRLGALLGPEERMQARNIYYTALEWEPKSVELLDSLAALLDVDTDAAERADVLERRLSIETGAAAESMALALHRIRMGLGDDAAAERALELGYRGHPASDELRDRLESLFRSRSEWRKLAELYELDASARVNPAESILRLKKAVAIWAKDVNDPDNAARALRLARDAAESDGDGTGADAIALLREHIDMLMEAGQLAAALAELSAAIDRLAADHPIRGALLAARANVLSASGNESRALEDLEAAFATDPATYAPTLAAQLERAGTAAAREGDVATARDHRLRRAQVLPHAGDPDSARGILSEMLKQDPKDSPALRALATLEERLERWEAASAALKRLVGLEGPERTVETALRLADACEHAGRPGDARGALERARAHAPQERPVRQRLERVYEQSGAWRELADLVLEDARTASDVADRFELLVRAGSLLLERANDPSDAVAAVEEAHALRPQDPNCVALLADAYTSSGRTQEAAVLLEPLITSHKGRRDRELAPLHFRMARVARRLGNTSDEARSLMLALECDAQNGQVCADVALRAMEADHLELANRALRAITLLKRAGPMSKALAYQHMGEIARKQGDPKRAMALLNRALSEDPSLEGARALIETIERGT
jgi:tetratricopeptide (TPR) repeat protein